MKNIFYFAAAFAVLAFTSCKNDAGEVLAVRLDETSIELVKGSEKQLTPTVVPQIEGVTYEWFSSMPEYVSVSSTGVVKAEKIYYKKEGDATASPVSVFCRCEGGAAECKVTVLPLDVERVEISSAQTSDALVMNPGDEVTVSMKYYPENADINMDEIVWSTTAFEYAVVKADKQDPSKATITAMWPGSVSIKATYGKVSSSIGLIVRPIQATSVTIAGPETVEMKVGSAKQLTASFLPANATVECLWNSENPKVVDVDPDSGVVTAIAEGTAKVKVVAGLVEDFVTVNVVSAE